MTRDHDGFARITLGALGGLAGTMAIQTLLTASKKWAPETLPPLRREPGDFMVEKAERVLPRNIRRQIPAAAEKGVGQMLGLGYGLTFGALYAALRPKGGSLLADGIVLGLVSWAAGYLGWLPGLGLMPPVWRQKPLQVAAPAAEHLVYGMATVGAYDWLKQHI